MFSGSYLKLYRDGFGVGDTSFRLSNFQANRPRTVLLTWSFLFCVLKIMQLSQAEKTWFVDANRTTDYLFDSSVNEFTQFNRNITSAICGVDPAIAQSDIAANYVPIQSWDGAFDPAHRATLFRGAGDLANSTIENCLNNLITPFNEAFEAQLKAKADADWLRWQAGLKAQADAEAAKAAAEAAAEADRKKDYFNFSLGMGLGLPGALGLIGFIMAYTLCIHSCIVRKCDDWRADRRHRERQRARERAARQRVAEVDIEAPVVQEEEMSSATEPSGSASTDKPIPEIIILTKAQLLEKYGYHGDIPEKFLCPISRHIMTNPEMIDDGHSYDKESLDELFVHQAEPNCPLSPDKKVTTRLPNYTLKSEIEEFMLKVKNEFEPSSSSESTRLGR